MKKFFAVFVLLLFLNTVIAAGDFSDSEDDSGLDGGGSFGPGDRDDFGSRDDGGFGPRDGSGPGFGGPGDFGPGDDGGFGPRDGGDFGGGPGGERFKGQENRGPNIPDFSKNPDGIYGMAFKYIDNDMKDEELFPLCGEPEKIADLLIGKIKSKVGDDVSTVCNDFPVSECTQRVEDSCGRMGSPPKEFMDGATNL